MDWTSTKKKKNEKSSTKAIVADIDLADVEDDVLNFNEMELIQNKSEKKKTESKPKTETVQITTKSKSETKKKSTSKQNKPTSSSRFVISLDDDDDLIEDIDKTPTKKQKTIAKTIESKKPAPPPSNKSISPSFIFPQESSIAKLRSFQESSSPPPVTDTLMWVEKYSPKTELELAVHKKKIQEVKEWLEQSFISFQNNLSNRQLLIIEGPSGAGKTAIMRALSRDLDFVIQEWINPAASIWKDVEGEVTTIYEKRLNQFKQFLLGSRGYSDLTGVSNLRKVIVIEDLPFLREQSDHKDFIEIIKNTMNFTKFPLILIVNTDGSSGYQAFTSLCQSKGTTVIKFNPISASKLKFALNRILTGEKLALSEEMLLEICESSNGDLRNAINTLQFYFVGAERNQGVTQNTKGKKKKEKSTTVKVPKGWQSILGNRDVCLSLFHALGKILYNKRLPPTIPDSEQTPTYRPQQDFVAEDIISSINMDPSMFTCFLQENMLHFIGDLEDLSLATQYLSDSDMYDGSETMSQYVSSVAARGLLYSNVHGVPPKWQPLFKPHLLQVVKDQKENKNVSEFFFNQNTERNAPMVPPTVLNTELGPLMFKIMRNSKKRTNSPLFSHLYRMSAYSAPYKVLGKNADKLDQSELPDLQAEEDSSSNQPKTSFVLLEDDIEEF